MNNSKPTRQLDLFIAKTETPLISVRIKLDRGITAHALHRDFETRSRITLKTAGLHKYSTDSSTEVLCVAYAVDHEPVQLWTPVALRPGWRVYWLRR